MVLSDLHGSEILWGTQDGHRSVPPESVPSSAKVPHDHHNDVQTSLRKGQWAASIDLKDAYFQVPIHPGARKFFRVAWEGKVYQFRALPFGLASAPWLFTELVRPLVEWAHRKGITMFAYLDDWLIVADSRTACQAAVQTVLSLARELGFRINVEKSELVPAQVFTFLGVEFDLSLGLVRPTVERVQKILEAIQDLLAATHRTARYWLHALGLLNSSFHTIQLGRLRGRPVQRYLASVWRQASGDLDDKIPPPSSKLVRDRFSWWLNQARLRRGVSIQPPPPPLNLFTDASHWGWGAHLDDLTANGPWSHQEKLAHINLLEMWAVDKALFEFRKSLVGSHVLLSTDNASVLAYLKNEGGTRSHSLLEAATQVLLFCNKNKISLSVKHLPGKLNVLADALSRADRAISTEWSLHPQLAQRVRDLAGSPVLDLFATRKNKRAPMFVSPFPDPQAWKVDALSFDWDSIHAYAFPPFPLISQVLEKVSQAEDCQIILVAPYWPSQKWFTPLLTMLVDYPRQLPAWSNVVSQPGFSQHRSPEWLALHAWPLSSDPCRGEAFLETLEPRLPRFMTENGKLSWIGVVNERLILSKPLYETWPIF